MVARRVLALVSFLIILASTGAAAQAGGAGANLGSGICVSQPAGSRVPGRLLIGPSIRSFALDDTTGHLFVHSTGNTDAQGRPLCAAGVVTVNAADGRVLQVARTASASELFALSSIAVHGPEHRVLAVDVADYRAGFRSTLSFLDTRSGHVLKTIPIGVRAGPIAVDMPTYRAFVLLNSASPTASLAVVAVTRGVVLRTMPVEQPVQDVAVDQRADRVFLIGSGLVTTLDGATGRTLHRAQLPLGYHYYSSYGLDERTSRLFVAETGLAPPHSGLSSNPPSTLSILDTQTGAVLKTITAGNGVLADKVMADPPAGIALGWAVNTDSAAATVFDSRDGSVRGQVHLPLPPGGFQGPIDVDPRSGEILGFTYRGIRAVQPGVWTRSRVISTTDISAFALALSVRTGHLFSLELDAPVAAGLTTLRAFCMRAGCS